MEHILKERLDSFTKIDLFIALEFYKAAGQKRMGMGWFGCIMNNCEAKTKNLRQFPVLGISLLSGVTFYISRIIAVIRGRGVSLYSNVLVLCFSSSLQYSHCGWMTLVPVSFFAEHLFSLRDPFVIWRSVSFLVVEVWRCLSDWILLMNKLFATIGNCFAHW